MKYDTICFKSTRVLLSLHAHLYILCWYMCYTDIIAWKHGLFQKCLFADVKMEIGVKYTFSDTSQHNIFHTETRPMQWMPVSDSGLTTEYNESRGT